MTVATGIERPQSAGWPAGRGGGAVLGLAALGWMVLLGRILVQRVYVSADTAINYAHVWYVSDSVWNGRGLPLRMPILGHGEAFTFPYGFLPWSVAALVRPMLGDWSVTLTLVLAAAGVIVATFWAFPELRRGWWGAAVLLEPALVSGPLLGQLPFLWASCLLMVAVGAWRRDRRALAVVTAGLAQATHPAIVLPMALALVVMRLGWEPQRRALVGCYLTSLVVALPAVVLTLSAPVFEDTSLATTLVVFAATIAPRSLIFVVPLALLGLGHHFRRAWTGPAVVGTLLVANIALWLPLGLPQSWASFVRQPDTHMIEFTHSDDFVPEATYRVLRAGDDKFGMYQLLRNGGRLDSEFFPESMQRRSWPNEETYLSFLKQRKVDFVVVWRGYTDRYGTNEEALLADAVARECRDGAALSLVNETAAYDVYAVDRACTEAPSVA